MAVVTEWEGLAHTVTLKDARLKIKLILIWGKSCFGEGKNQAVQLKCKIFSFYRNAFFEKCQCLGLVKDKLSWNAMRFQKRPKENHSRGCVIPALSNLVLLWYVWRRSCCVVCAARGAAGAAWCGGCTWQLCEALLCPFCRLAAGTTRFCAGIVSTARPVSVELKMAHYSNKLYQQLQQETGVQTGTESVTMESSLGNGVEVLTLKYDFLLWFYCVLRLEGPVQKPYVWT